MPKLTHQRHDPALQALGEAIRAARLAKDVSQEGLALQAGVDRSYVGRIERGENNIAVLTLIKIARALDSRRLVNDPGVVVNTGLRGQRRAVP